MRWSGIASRRARRALLAGFFTSTAIGCLSGLPFAPLPPGPRPGEGASLHGHVFDEADSVAGVLIRVEGTKNADTTSSGGEFHLLDLHPREVSLIVEKNQVITRFVTPALQRGRNYGASIHLDSLDVVGDVWLVSLDAAGGDSTHVLPLRRPLRRGQLVLNRARNGTESIAVRVDAFTPQQRCTLSVDDPSDASPKLVSIGNLDINHAGIGKLQLAPPPFHATLQELAGARFEVRSPGGDLVLLQGNVPPFFGRSAPPLSRCELSLERVSAPRTARARMAAIPAADRLLVDVDGLQSRQTYLVCVRCCNTVKAAGARTNQPVAPTARALATLTLSSQSAVEFHDVVEIRLDLATTALDVRMAQCTIDYDGSLLEFIGARAGQGASAAGLFAFLVNDALPFPPVSGSEHVLVQVTTQNPLGGDIAILQFQVMRDITASTPLDFDLTSSGGRRHTFLAHDDTGEDVIAMEDIAFTSGAVQIDAATGGFVPAGRIQTGATGSGTLALTALPCGAATLADLSDCTLQVRGLDNAVLFEGRIPSCRVPR